MISPVGTGTSGTRHRGRPGRGAAAHVRTLRELFSAITEKRLELLRHVAAHAELCEQPP
jgi:hypothetical protein